MTLKNVKSSLGKISKSLAEVQDNREFLLRNTREILYAKETKLRQTRSDLATAEYALSSAKRILGDTESAKKRVELECRMKKNMFAV